MLEIVRGGAASGKGAGDAVRPKRSSIAHMVILTSNDASMAWSIASHLVWLYDIGDVTVLFHNGGTPADISLTRHSGNEIVFRSREASSFQHLDGCFDGLGLPSPADVVLYDWMSPKPDPTLEQLADLTEMLQFDPYCSQAMLGHVELLAYFRRKQWLGAEGCSAIWLSIGNRPELTGLPGYGLYDQAMAALRAWSIAADHLSFKEGMSAGQRTVYLPVAVRPFCPEPVVHYQPDLSLVRANQAARELSDDIVHAFQRRVSSNLQPRADHLLEPIW